MSCVEYRLDVDDSLEVPVYTKAFVLIDIQLIEST